MRLRADDPKLYTVRWFFCAPTAKPLPFPHRYASLNWEEKPIKQPDVGEICGAPRNWQRGENFSGAPGTNYCGSRDAWENGATTADPDVAVGPFGYPVCCDTPFPFGLPNTVPVVAITTNSQPRVEACTAPTVEVSATVRAATVTHTSPGVDVWAKSATRVDGCTTPTVVITTGSPVNVVANTVPTPELWGRRVEVEVSSAPSVSITTQKRDGQGRAQACTEPTVEVDTNSIDIVQACTETTVEVVILGPDDTLVSTETEVLVDTDHGP